MLRKDQLEVVAQFEYLGSISTSVIAAADSALQQLEHANIWSYMALTLSIKMQLFQ